MKLLQEIMFNVLCKKMKVIIPEIEELKELFQLECYKALREIKQIIDNQDLSDKDCFSQIEEIVCAFEKIGSYSEGRHDF